MCFVWKISQQLSRSWEHKGVAKPRLVILEPGIASARAIPLAQRPARLALMHREGFLKADRKKRQVKQCRHGIRMTQLEKWSFAFIDFSSCSYTECYENVVASFRLSVTHQKIFSAHSGLAGSLMTSTQQLFLELKGT